MAIHDRYGFFRSLTTVKSQTARAVRALREHLTDVDLEVSDASA